MNNFEKLREIFIDMETCCDTLNFSPMKGLISEAKILLKRVTPEKEDDLVADIDDLKNHVEKTYEEKQDMIKNEIKLDMIKNEILKRMEEL